MVREDLSADPDVRVWLLSLLINENLQGLEDAQTAQAMGRTEDGYKGLEDLLGEANLREDKDDAFKHCDESLCLEQGCLRETH